MMLDDSRWERETVIRTRRDYMMIIEKSKIEWITSDETLLFSFSGVKAIC